MCPSTDNYLNIVLILQKDCDDQISREVSYLNEKFKLKIRTRKLRENKRLKSDQLLSNSWRELPFALTALS